MDIFSHGLWGGMLLGRKRYFWPALVLGMLPDALAFIPHLATLAWTGNLSLLTGLAYPAWVHNIYNYTHSLVIAGLVFSGLCLLRLEWGLVFLAWPLHILLDIPFHSAASFPTKFLFPLSQLFFDGISWRKGYIFFGNWLALAATYLLLALKNRKQKSGFAPPPNARPKLLPQYLFQPPVNPAWQQRQPAQQVDLTQAGDGKSSCRQQAGLRLEDIQTPAQGDNQERYRDQKSQVSTHALPGPDVAKH